LPTSAINWVRYPAILTALFDGAGTWPPGKPVCGQRAVDGGFRSRGMD
jgi:hypothetical protein